MLELGIDLIEFRLVNTISEVEFSSDELEINKPSLIMFICNHCPYVIHYHDQIRKIAEDYSEEINLVAISSNDIENYPDDRPEMMKVLWEDLDLKFPYLYDENQEVAKKYKAECTPEFYLFDHDNKLAYRGRLDESSPGSSTKPTGKDLRKAINNILNNKDVSVNQFPSMGCNIKWK